MAGGQKRLTPSTIWGTPIKSSGASWLPSSDTDARAVLGEAWHRAADGRVELFANQGSGVLTSTVWADGLVDVAPGQTVVPGDIVRFLPLAALCAPPAAMVQAPGGER